MKNLLLAAATSALLLSPALGAEPIAQTDAESSGVSLQVTEFKVSNGTVMMKFAIANDTAGAYEVYQLRDESIAKDVNAVSGIFLVDVPNKKKYFPVIDTDGHCICSRDVPNLASKQSVNLWVRFPAPPDNVTKIGVVVPHFLPMDDVPLTR
ncbi:MAG: hypothetical protein ACLQJR_15000 [Stellaceae bacterium]